MNTLIVNISQVIVGKKVPGLLTEHIKGCDVARLKGVPKTYQRNIGIFILYIFGTPNKFSIIVFVKGASQKY